MDHTEAAVNLREEYRTDILEAGVSHSEETLAEAEVNHHKETVVEAGVSQEETKINTHTKINCNMDVEILVTAATYAVIMKEVQVN